MHYHNDSADEAESCQYNERNELTKRTVTEQTETGAPAVSATTLYRYDNNGSLISEEQNGRTSEYRYDLLNRQTYVRTLEGRIQENGYNGENMRAGLTKCYRKRKCSLLYLKHLCYNIFIREFINEGSTIT